MTDLDVIIMGGFYGKAKKIDGFIVGVSISQGKITPLSFLSKLYRSVFQIILEKYICLLPKSPPVYHQQNGKKFVNISNPIG